MFSRREATIAIIALVAIPLGALSVPSIDTKPPPRPPRPRPMEFGDTATVIEVQVATVTLEYRGYEVREPRHLFDVDLKAGDEVLVDWGIREKVYREKRRQACINTLATKQEACEYSQSRVTCQQWMDAARACNRYWKEEGR